MKNLLRGCLKVYRLAALFTAVIFSSAVNCLDANSDVDIFHYVLAEGSYQTVTQSGRYLPVVDQADVVVAGGGISGVTAALRAAHEGRSVILLETRNYFGQEYTATYKCRTRSGIPDRASFISASMVKELTEAGTLADETVDPQALRLFLHQKVSEQPLITVYLYSMATGVIKEDNRVRGVVFSGRDGRQAVLAKSVIDATEDGRLSTAAGGELLRTMSGDKTARRFISASLPANIPAGPLNVENNSRLRNAKAFLHKGFVEIEMPVRIGEDVAGDLSRVHGETMEMSFAIRDHFQKTGWVTLITLDDYRSSLTPAPETYIDEMPLVECIDPLKPENFSSIDKLNSSIITPKGTEGIFATGRTVIQDSDDAYLINLLAIGEFAGKSASEMAAGIDEFIETEDFKPEISFSDTDLQVRELLQGIEPGRVYPGVFQHASELPVRGEYDVIVVGGGTSGAIAAISAARHGASVAVLEVLPNLGGIGSNRVSTYYWGSPWKSLLRLELGDRLHLLKSPGVGPLEKVRLSGEDKKHALHDMAVRAGVHIYYQSLGAGAVVEGNSVKGVVVENSSGRHVLLSTIVIDATGHAGIAVAAGAKYEKGRSSDGFLHEIEHGPLRNPSHLGDISTSYMKFPSYAVSLNIRESRRIVGDYIVSFPDAVRELVYPDVICRWRSNYDTHFPTSANQSDLAQDWTAILGLWRRPILGAIPYRSILPAGVNNILVAAMAYSTDHDALIGGRMQSDMEHLGEAAGLAAAMACQMHLPLREVPIGLLQDKLVALGVLRDHDVPGRRIAGGPSLEELHRQDLWRAERLEAFPPDAPAIDLEGWIARLGTGDALEAMLQIYLAGDKSIPLLRPMLGSDNRSKHEEVAVLLGMLGDRSSIPALIEFLKERNTRRFEYTLPHASSRPSVPLYWSAIILLGRFGEETAVPMMTEILSGPPPPREFGMLTRSAYGVDMFENTETCPPPLASFIIVALGRIGDPGAAESIRPFLAVSNPIDNIIRENSDFEISWGVQTNAAWSLAKLGDMSGVPFLIDLLEADQERLRNYARMLLETITGKEFGRCQHSWKEWWQTTG